MANTSVPIKRVEIPYFEGINTSVAHNISKKQELDVVANARSNMIGNIEKRQGYARVGNSLTFTGNYGMFFFESSASGSRYFYRVSKSSAITSIYYLNVSDKWIPLTAGGTALSSSMFSFVSAEDCMFMVNGTDNNRYLTGDGTTIVDSTSTTGHLYNCPVANKISYYKDALYVADYTVSSTRYKNSILRSSNPLGRISIIDGDYNVEVLIDNWNDTNQDTVNSLSGAYTAIGQGFTGTANALSACKFFMKKTGTITGNAYAKLYAHSGTYGTTGVPTGTALATSDSFDVSTLTTAFRSVSLKFSGANKYVMTASTKYFIVLEYTLSGTGSLDLGSDSASGYTGNMAEYNGSWVANSGVDLCFYVYGMSPNGAVKINVTDTKYIRQIDELDVYRGGSLITTLTVTGKGEDYIEVAETDTVIYSADELWVHDTYTGTRMFRWPDNPCSGIGTKQVDTFKLSGGNNDRIKMLVPIGNVLMAANNNNICVWDNYKWDSYKTENMDVGIGCVSDQGYVKALGTLWFIHYTGIYASTGAYPKLMSAKVEKYIQGATKSGLEACAAGRKGLSIFFSIGDVTLYKPDGSVSQVVNDVVLEYNMRHENWFVHTGIDAKYFRTYNWGNDTDLLGFSGTSGDVYQFLVGNNDNNKEIPWELTTSPITLSTNFETICYPKEVIIEMERGSGIKCFVSLDGAPFYEIKGEAIKGCTVLKVTPQSGEEKYARCRNIAISIREFSKSLCKLSRVAVTYTETPEVEPFKEQYGQ